MTKSDRSINQSELYDKYLETIGLRENHFLRSAFIHSKRGMMD